MATSNKFFGWMPSPPDPRDYKYQIPPEHLVALPDKVDLQQPPPGVPFDPAFDQGALGSCGPNSLAANLLYRLMDEGHRPSIPSRLFLYYCTRELMGTVNQDSGVYNRAMLKALEKFGWCDETLWRYDIREFRRRPSNDCYQQAADRVHKIRYEAVAQELTAMKSCIASKTPIIFGFTVFSSIDRGDVDRTGEIPYPARGDRPVGGHDVLLTGYDDSIRKFQLRNSWGTWGQNGNGTIPYDYALNPNMAGDFWRVVDAAGPLPPPAPPSPPAPPGPPDIGALVVQLMNDTPKGSYIMLPAQVTAELRAAGVDFGKLLQIFFVVLAFIQRKDYSPTALLQLIAQIQAILNAIPF